MNRFAKSFAYTLMLISRYDDGIDRVDRYRCHIGHSYSEKDLVIKQAEIFESTLWIALRIMEERKTLLKKIASDNTKKGFSKLAKSYREKEMRYRYILTR